MRYLGRSGVFCCALAALLFTPMIAPGAGADGAVGADAQPFRIAAHPDGEIAGTYSGTSSRVLFMSKLVTPARAVLQIRIDDVVLDANVDFASKTAVLNGHGRALTAQQIRALQAVGNDLERYLAPERREPLPHEDMLYRVLSFYTLIPPGSSLDRLEVVATFNATHSNETFAGGGVCGGGDIEELFDCTSGASCSGDNGDGISYLDSPCDCDSYDVWHDSFDHCFCREDIRIGCDLDANCVGRGGAGCDGGLIFGLDCKLAGGNGAGIYTIDFAEHDRCCNQHDDAGVCDNLACFDEAIDAADDCLFGQQNCNGCAGACCFPNSSCQNLSDEGCTAAGGAFRGLGTSCATLECPVTEACCVPVGCFDIEVAKCLEGNGIPDGPGSVCATTECGQFGACCFVEAETCVDGVTEEGCVGAGAEYLGAGSLCETSVCGAPRGACCFPGGECTSDAPAADCGAAGGTYQGDGSICGTTTCPAPPIGACCFEQGGACAPDVIESGCTAAGGVYQGDDSECGPDTCPLAALGACCFTSTGTCVELVAEADCAEVGADYLGDGSLCTTADCVPPAGACCFGPDQCADAPESECAAAGGSYQGNGAVCASATCPPAPFGACCFVDANACASDASEGDCDATGGMYQGDGSVCGPNTCPIAVRGACCFTDTGACIDLTAEPDCLEAGGEYLGDASTCAAAECDPRVGACCFAAGECAPDAAEPDCTAATGVYQGDGSDCDTVDCSHAPGDADGDGDIDLTDYSLFEDCAAGPGVPPDPTPPTTVAACLAAFDFDADQDVDVQDFGGLQATFTGPG